MRTVVQLFIKYPRPGRVKTRLHPVLGEDGATALHCELAERQLHLVSSLPAHYVGELWGDADADRPIYQRWLKRWPTLRYRRQVPGDLGERMRCALRRAIPYATGVIQMGSDCPVLTREHLEMMANALRNGADGALIGAEDGGYVLAGYNHYRRDLFSGIDWGTGTVLAQTVRQFRREGLCPVVYPPLWDVDRPEDVERYRQLDGGDNQ